MAMLDSRKSALNQKLESKTNSTSSQCKIESISLKLKDQIDLTG